MTSHENPQKPDLEREVDVRARRKLRAKKRAGSEVWFGLGMMGIIGWSVSIPTLLGVFMGLWLDRNYPDGRSWTLALLVAGLALGCWNAWYWVAKEDRAIREEQEDDDI
ncbi:MAG: AtpZ/AtpI family protein [Desulfomicrobium apsheronum]|nr:AtpZ/AtpI family protein [Desulfomicrobium apsheronum]